MLGAVRNPQMRFIIAGMAMMALVVAPTLAAAESCADLAAQRQRLQREMQDLVLNYPGTHVVIGMCAAGAQSNFESHHNEGDAIATFSICAAIGCSLVVGFSNCMTVAKEWFDLALRAQQLDEQIRRQNC